MQNNLEQIAGDRITGARDYQEDTFEVVRLRKDGSDEWLLLLADGMGGHVGGARASELAVATFAAHFEQAIGDVAARLRTSLDAADDAIKNAVTEDSRYAGMGCTLVACLIAGDTIHWLSVGDSPLWLLREDKMTRLNIDHSMRPILESLVELGRMSAEELEDDPRLNQLRSAVTGEGMRMVDENKSLLLSTNDQVILASDGLETLTMDEIGGICREQNTPANAIAALLAAINARQRPGQDNTTAVLYRHKE